MMSLQSMKIALIRPPKIQGAIEKSMVQQPITLCYIAAFLMRDGASVQIWDFEVESLSRGSLKSRLDAFKPSAVGITSMTTNVVAAASIAKTVKEIVPNIKIIIGGPHSSALPKRTLEEFPAFDASAYGEGEVTALEVFQRWKAGQNLKD